MATVPTYVRVSPRTTFEAGTDLPVVTDTPTLFADQGVLDAVAIAAELTGVALYYSDTGEPPGPLLGDYLTTAVQAFSDAQKLRVRTNIGAVDLPTVQGIALVQALIFGG